MKQCILHIGLDKTGSTFLQKKVFPEFYKYKVVTPSVTEVSPSFNRITSEDDSLYSVSELKDELKELLEEDYLFISDESFNGRAIYRHVNRTIVASRLSQLFPDATILIFIRGQASIAQSIYNQYVKGRRRGDKEIYEYFLQNRLERLLGKAFLEKDSLDYLEGERYHLDMLKYSYLIDLYKSYFNNVHVLLYEDLKNDLPKTLSQLETIFDYKLSESSYNKILSSKPTNQGLNNVLLERRRIENMIYKIPFKGLGWKIIRKGMLLYLYLSQVYRDNKGVKEVTQILDKYFAEDNKALLSKYPDIGIQNYPKAYCINN